MEISFSYADIPFISNTREIDTDLVILNRSQMRRRHLSWHPLSKLLHHTKGKTFGHDIKFNVLWSHIQVGSSVETGLESGTLRPQTEPYH
ncbi:hypothetical protein AVEN_91338-1 [Araneus ventricosus]|uniref:Uncharacterized protein n=1 Tax=Araneus ventricosus TaxID=182803 RepID=A0A4Y2IZ23_ARAVE|nr:hypothetical protein AVEN_91338-1 [Araneus ventricosus]